MDKIDIVICIHFSNENNVISLRDIVELTDKWGDFLNKRPDRISYSLISDKGKRINKNLKYTSKNIEAVYQISKDEKLGFELYKLAENYYLQSRDIDISMIYGKFFVKDLHSLTFHFDSEVFKNVDESFDTILNDLILLLKKLGDSVNYGVIVPMEREKSPGFYVAGIASQGLTEEERKKAFAWGHYSSQCTEKVWDMFWGTILTKNHLYSDEIIKKLRKIVGEKSVNEICEGLYLITYPINILEYEKQKNTFHKYHSKLTHLLEEYNLIMGESHS